MTNAGKGFQPKEVWASIGIRCTRIGKLEKNKIGDFFKNFLNFELGINFWLVFRTTPWNAKNAGSGAHSSSTSGLGSEDRPWKCEQCDASFKMKGALMSHRDVVHYNLKNHVCNMCGEAFKSASSLRGHVRRHEGRRDYKCEVCHKEYYTYSALKGHKVVHQTARDFICGICGKAFKKKKALEVRI